MPLNKQAVAELQEDLRRHRFIYDQSTFGRPEAAEAAMEPCNTACCLAGELYIKAKGFKVFKAHILNDRYASEELIVVGAEALGLIVLENDDFRRFNCIPQIFRTVSDWPADLRKLYQENRHEAAIQALDRLQEDGSIAEAGA